MFAILADSHFPEMRIWSFPCSLLQGLPGSFLFLLDHGVVLRYAISELLNLGGGLFGSVLASFGLDRPNAMSEELANASLDDLIHVDEIGEKIAQSIRLYFANEKNQELIRRLQEAGLRFEADEEDLAGQTDKLWSFTLFSACQTNCEGSLTDSLQSYMYPNKGSTSSAKLV